MGKDLSRWMGATADIDNIEKQTKNPTTMQRIFKSGQLEASAIEAVVAQKKLQKQRKEMKVFLNMTYGPNAWNEVLKYGNTLDGFFYFAQLLVLSFYWLLYIEKTE